MRMKKESKWYGRHGRDPVVVLTDFCRTKGSGIHFVVLVVGIKSNLAYILIFRRYFFRYLGRRADC